MRTLPALATLLLAAALAAGCAADPDRPRRAPLPVYDLDFEPIGQPPLPVVLQYRERGTLVLDILGAQESGAFRVRPGRSGRWPARISVRMPQGRFAVLEVVGSERMVLPITRSPGGQLDLVLPPTLLSPTPPALSLRWGASAPDPEVPAAP